MIIEVGEKVHVMYRSLYEKSMRRHFIGTVTAAKDALCRIEGYVFIYDDKKTEFVRKPELRTTIMDLAESDYIVNLIDSNVIISDIRYKYAQGVGLVASDNKDFSLNINEFGVKS
ncbi:hypothetical protein [Marinicellulosiphila megalodicopiae]|uniref:hypothetical protein n=1 Tax=Marinicellulosiphila megalodicopiae TaxID=2724896 RepID=UPI003BB1DBAA